MSTANIPAVHRQLCHLITNLPAARSCEGVGPLSRADESSWIDFAEMADANLVTPAVWSALRQVNASGEVPIDFRDYFQAALEWNTARNLEIRKELARAISQLNDRGIVPILLKGAAYISDRVYANVGERILGDLDILVPDHQADLAQEAFKSLGYVAAGPPDFDYEYHHHNEPLKNPSCQAYVEIHREVIAPPHTHILPATDVIGDAQRRERDGTTYALPSPTHAALISFVHSQLTDRCNANARVNIRSLMDIAHLSARYGETIDWSCILRRMEANGSAQPLRNYFYVLQEYARLEVSPELSQTFRARLYCYLIGATLRSSLLRRSVNFFDDVSSWRIGEQYGTGPKGTASQLARTHHVVRAIGRAFKP